MKNTNANIRTGYTSRTCRTVYTYFSIIININTYKYILMYKSLRRLISCSLKMCITEDLHLFIIIRILTLVKLAIIIKVNKEEIKRVITKFEIWLLELKNIIYNLLCGFVSPSYICKMH